MATFRNTLFLLATVFLVHAQEVRVQDNPTNLNFASGSIGQVPTVWTVPPTRIQAGYSAELRREGCHSSIGCAVLTPPPAIPNRDGVLWQRFSAVRYRGATVQVRAWIRLDRTDAKSRAQFEFRVDRPNHLPGFHDDMTDRPVHSGDWQLCNIVGKVAEDAQYLNVALKLVGTTKAWVDDVAIETVDSNTAWTAADPSKQNLIQGNLKPLNLDFSQGEEGQLPPGWWVPPFYTHLLYSAELRRVGCHSNIGCAVVLVPLNVQNKDLLGSMVQRIIAQPYRGRTLRVSTWLRLDARSPEDAAEIAIGVERPNDQSGFHDERRVQSSGWEHVEVVGRIDDDANYLNIALVSAGRGDAWMDGVTIEEIPAQVPVAHALAPDSAWPANLAFADGATGGVPTGWEASKSVEDKGYAAELRRSGCWSGTACAVVLAATTLPVAVLTQSFDGTPHRGKNFRFRARLRVDKKDTNDSAEIYIDVVRPNRRSGLRSGRAIHAADWTECEITGRIGEDAESIRLTLLSRGKGAAWVDDVSFEILDSPGN